MPFASILICAKNEAKNLQSNLPLILNQDYPNFEVIVVNDQSTDASLQVLQNLRKMNSHLKVFTTIGKSNKKKALVLAKQKASGKVYVLTDADCQVASKQWLVQVLSKIQNENQVVLGYAPYRNQTGYLNKLQTFDTLTTAMQYFSAALFNSPYMGVGRNMAYTQKLDKKISFNPQEEQLLSGDDDLWIQKAKKQTKIQVQLAKNSFAYSDAEPNLKAWWNQKKRHITTANQYEFKDQFLLSGVFLIKFLFWISFFSLAFAANKLNFWTVFLFLILTQMGVYKWASHRLSGKNIWWLSPILDFSLICFQFCLFISNLVSPINKWK